MSSTDVAVNARNTRAPRLREEYRNVGGSAFGKAMAAVNLWPLGGATKITCASDSVAAAAVVLPDNGGAISVLASGGRLRFKLGDEDVEATTTSHAMADGERMEFILNAAETHISIICDDGVEAAQLDITGLGQADAA
jgi:hypothetical protein